jgi:hypothetical protein
MIIINNKKYESVGQSISIINGKIVIDGNNVTPDTKKINIVVDGDIENIHVDYCESIKIKGNVSNGVNTTSGDVEIDGNVTGNVKTTSGDIRCNNVGGEISTISGNVKYKK